MVCNQKQEPKTGGLLENNMPDIYGTQFYQHFTTCYLEFCLGKCLVDIFFYVNFFLKNGGLKFQKVDR